MGRSFKSIVFEVSMIVMSMSVVGHLTVNFWERYFVKNELTQIKDSLYNLKKTLANIGTAYDALHKDLKNLAEYSTKNALFITNFDYTKFHNNLDRRRLHDIALNTVIDAKHIQMKPPDKDDNYKLISNKNIENITPNPSPEIIYKTNIVHNHHDAAKIYKPIGFYPIDKKKHDVTVHAVLKNTDKVSANATTMTRNPLMSRRI